MTGATKPVRASFAEPQWYLSRRSYNIQIRQETVQKFVQGRRFTRILDVACGDGSASIPLFQAGNELTLLDMSAAMLEIAKCKLPANLSGEVHFVNDDFLRADLPASSFDLIICLGLIAHVDSPAEVIAKIARLLAPGGTVVMEGSDAGHFLNHGTGLKHHFLRATGRINYQVQLTTSRALIEMFERLGLRLRLLYRYSLPTFLPGFERIAPQRMLYNLVHLLYGSAAHNRNAWLGKECLYLFESSSAADSFADKNVTAQTAPDSVPQASF